MTYEELLALAYKDHLVVIIPTPVGLYYRGWPLSQYGQRFARHHSSHVRAGLAIGAARELHAALHV